jgi:Family of unknown function (DUF6286)
MSAYRRIERRETHSSRAGLAIVLAVILILALAYLVTEIVLGAVRQHALLISPADMVHDIAALSAVATGILVGGGVVLAVLGLVLVIAALTPGRRARHLERSDRAAVVIDNEVIASALVRTAANAAGIDPDRAVGSVSRRRAAIRITPSSGMSIDRDAVAAAVTARVDEWDLSPALKPSIVIEKAGKVGA